MHLQANPEAWGNVASFVIANGPANKTEDEITYRKATAFQMRLFEYELPGESVAQLARDAARFAARMVAECVCPTQTPSCCSRRTRCTS